MTRPTFLTVAELKATVLPSMFLDPVQISEYGQTGASSASALETFQSLMKNAPITVLAAQISKVVAKLKEADPKTLTEAPSWLDKVLGRDVEKVVLYKVARVTLDELLATASGAAASVRETVKGLESLIEGHHAEVDQLTAYIEAGNEYLAENPSAGEASPGALEFDRPRERLARKVTNLAALRAAHEMSEAQMRLTRAQAMDILDRFNETTTLLVPVWRQHTMALTNAKSLDPSIVSQATKAHQALLRSLQGLEAEQHN